MRRTLAVIALDRSGEVSVVRAALGELGVDTGVLVAAEVAGAVVLEAGVVRFAAEASRDVAVAALTPGERRAIHGALAAAMPEPRHRAERAEHLVAAAVGPDAAAADALAELGREASLQGDTTRAAELFGRAAELSPDAEDRAHRLHLSADAHWNSGEYTAARVAFEAAYIGSTKPLQRAETALQLGQLDMFQRGPRFGRDLFVAAAEAVAPHDGDRAAMLLVQAASTEMLSSDVIGCMPLVRRACVLAAAGDGSSVVAANLMLAFVSLQHGERVVFDELFPALSEIADLLVDTDAAEADLFLQLVGMVHVYTERWDTGRVYLSSVAHRAGRRSRFATAALASATLAELCWRSGRWDEAWTLATSSMVSEVTLVGARLWLLAFTAHLDAGFGRADDCRRRAHEAIVDSSAMGFGTAVIWAYHALGLLELGLGHAVAAASHLDHIDAIAAAHEIVEPSSVWWQADHVEALVRSGRMREARHALARFEAGAAASPSRWAAATTWRCRGLLAADGDDAEQCFTESLIELDHLPAPFELGRTLLCRAERRVAVGSALDPAADLAEAIAIFASLGASAWAAQALALRDAIESLSDPPPGEVLSPAERRVADAVVGGMTNREVAAALYVSEKTVEFHLHNVYRKLGVRSRTQLVRRLKPA